MSEPTKEQLCTRLAVINDHYKETMFYGDYPLLGVKVHNAEINAIFALIESSGENEKITLYPGRRWDELSREQQAQYLKDCEEGARNTRLGPAPDIKPGVNIGPLSGPRAISAKEVEDAMRQVEKWHRAWVYEVDGATPFEDSALAVIRSVIDDYATVKAECVTLGEAAEKFSKELSSLRDLLKAVDDRLRATREWVQKNGGTYYIEASLAKLKSAALALSEEKK